MSKRYSRRVRPCAKRGYLTQDEAEAMLRKLWERPGRVRYEARAYECPNCHRWHLTSQLEMVTRVHHAHS